MTVMSLHVVKAIEYVDEYEPTVFTLELLRQRLPDHNLRYVVTLRDGKTVAVSDWYARIEDADAVYQNTLSRGMVWCRPLITTKG